LDGISLVPLLGGAMRARPAPMGFWQFPGVGRRVPSAQWMGELLEAQRSGKDLGIAERLCMDAGVIAKQYPENEFPGHAAWLDWPWKLHRIQNESQSVGFELYDLAHDPNETTNVAADHPDQVARMKAGLASWLSSVVQSLNGRDSAGEGRS
jgi:hypothetical protein